MQECILDLLYTQHPDAEAYVRKLLCTLRKEYEIKEDKAGVTRNWRNWNWIDYVHSLALDQGDYFIVTFIYQFALNNEVSLQQDNSKHLTERKEFYETQWLPLLKRETIRVLENMSGTDSVIRCIEEYEREMRNSWITQYAHVEEIKIDEDPLDPTELEKFIE